MTNAQDTNHRIEDHLEHGLWAQTCADHIGDSLTKRVRSDHGANTWQTFAVMLEICAFLPDCLSGAMSGKRVDQHTRNVTQNDCVHLVVTVITYV